ncbi:MAG: hypothetical protein H6905_01260 [Hyphomicrobiales bacterium]|nr:hypothetical protein [Hyphomicrobiales bacterium]
MNTALEDRLGQICAQLFPFNDPHVTRGWLEQDGALTGPAEEKRRVIARFELPTGGEVQLLNLSVSESNPNIAVAYSLPATSRGRSPRESLLSPLELFLAFNTGEPVPMILQRHHESLARRGIFDRDPRALSTPLWGAPDPNLPPEYGPVDLCEGSFIANWSWFSMGHGVNNQHAAMELWTNWSVLTGTSAPRSAALCMAETPNPRSASARYVILNRQGDGPWENIFSSGWMGPGEGVGFQVYGPDDGRTRILLTTQNDDRYIFWAGASWGVPQDWLSP